jgi:selenocysteine lyase/cysteine desulfurase
MQSAVAFHQAIGRERIEERVTALALALRQGVQRAMPQSRFRSPADPGLSSGVVVFEIPGLDSAKAFAALYEDHMIGCAAMGSALRFSPNIYNLMAEVDKVIGALRQMA